MKNYVLIFSLNGLDVFAIEEAEKNPYASGEIYWQHPSYPSGYFGPFPTVYDAVRHYEELSKAVAVETEGNVVKVDFVSKRALPPTPPIA